MNPNVLLAIPLLPLVAAIIAGLGGRYIGRTGAHLVTIAAVAASCVLSLRVLKAIYWDGAPRFDGTGLHLAGERWHDDAGRLPDRPAHGADDGGGDLRLAVRARLHHRLHARRPGLHALLQLHLAVHLLDADAGDVEQLHAAVLRLGSGGRGLVPADRLLVHAAERDLRQPEGLPGQPRRATSVSCSASPGLPISPTR